MDRLVASGRVTPQEAVRLQAEDPAETASALAEIRVRHARAVLDAAVEAGEIDPSEVHALLDRLRSGEHPAELRTRINRLRRSASSAAPSVSETGVDGGSL